MAFSGGSIHLNQPPPHPHLELWKVAYEKGYAGVLADEIVRQRDLPDDLFVAVYAPVRRPFTLSRRQREVLTLASVGWENSQIAKALRISPHTVKQQLARISEIFEVQGRTAIVAEAIRCGEIR